jgi:hypothetical protein
MNPPKSNEAIERKIDRDREIRSWKKIIPTIAAFMNKKELTIVDIGAAEGHFLLAAADAGILKRGILVDEKWNIHYERFLKAYKYDQNYYLSKKIEILNIDGLSNKVPFDQADLVVKTFCSYSGITLDKILSRTNANWLIACYVEQCNFKKFGLEEIFSFDLYDIPKNLKLTQNSHYLLRRKKIV